MGLEVYRFRILGLGYREVKGGDNLKAFGRPVSVVI